MFLPTKHFLVKVTVWGAPPNQCSPFHYNVGMLSLHCLPPIPPWLHLQLQHWWYQHQLHLSPRLHPHQLPLCQQFHLPIKCKETVLSDDSDDDTAMSRLVVKPEESNTSDLPVHKGVLFVPTKFVCTARGRIS